MRSRGISEKHLLLSDLVFILCLRAEFLLLDSKTSGRYLLSDLVVVCCFENEFPSVTFETKINLSLSKLIITNNTCDFRDVPGPLDLLDSDSAACKTFTFQCINATQRSPT